MWSGCSRRLYKNKECSHDGIGFSREQDERGGKQLARKGVSFGLHGQQAKAKHTALAGDTLDADLPAELAHNLLHDRQAQPMPLGVILLQALPRFEESDLMIGRHTRPVVLHPEFDRAIRADHAPDFQARRTATIIQGIAEVVEPDFFDPRGIAQGHRKVIGLADLGLGDVNPDRFGIFGWRGQWFVQDNRVRDFLAFNKIELLP